MHTASAITLDIPAILSHLAGGTWTEIPRLRINVGYGGFFYTCGAREAYVVLDDDLRITVDDALIFEGGYKPGAFDERIRNFVTHP